MHMFCYVNRFVVACALLLPAFVVVLLLFLVVLCLVLAFVGIVFCFFVQFLCVMCCMCLHFLSGQFSCLHVVCIFVFFCIPRPPLVTCFCVFCAFFAALFLHVVALFMHFVCVLLCLQN